MNKSKISFAILAAGTLAACNDNSSDNQSQPTPNLTAPAMHVAAQKDYIENTRMSARTNASWSQDIDWDFLTEKFNHNLESYHLMAENSSLNSESESYPGYNTLNEYNLATTYSKAGNVIKFTDGSGRYGVFQNKWWTQGDEPSFKDNSGPWNLIVQTDQNGNYLSEAETTSEWDQTATYNAGDKVIHIIDGYKYNFEAKYWTKGDAPILTISSGVDGVTTEDWKSPWKHIEGLSTDVTTPDKLPDPDVISPPVCYVDCDDTTNPGDPTLPPIIPDPEPTEPDVEPPVEPEKPELEPETNLPESGYAFLRELTPEHWDWFFPMRSGRYNVEGGTRNTEPFAKPDGSTDVFSLSAFKDAVIEYNAWAASKGYKQFLNEGTKSQQALEFLSFWAKSSRETSGSWDNAPAPWIVQEQNIEGDIWKGALYWVEEVGYTTDENGISTAINYVDSGSAYTPYPNRSYYGRGVIQLSWNYNYGAFSEWLYNNGLMKDLITRKDTLLERPDYVATNGQLSILSGIWFWMTPQGAKPSSHDVIYGDMTHVSTYSSDRGLPQRNDGGNIPTEVGESYNESVIAYRLGTITNIVNGGLECNRAAKWHSGPVQRVAYFNAYAQYMNNEITDLNVPLVTQGINVWSQKISEADHDDLKMATCFAQKSYYGW